MGEEASEQAKDAGLHGQASESEPASELEEEEQQKEQEEEGQKEEEEEAAAEEEEEEEDDDDSDVVRDLHITIPPPPRIIYTHPGRGAPRRRPQAPPGRRGS